MIIICEIHYTHYEIRVSQGHNTAEKRLGFGREEEVSGRWLTHLHSVQLLDRERDGKGRINCRRCDWEKRSEEKERQWRGRSMVHWDDWCWEERIHDAYYWDNRRGGGRPWVSECCADRRCKYWTLIENRSHPCDDRSLLSVMTDTESPRRTWSRWLRREASRDTTYRTNPPHLCHTTIYHSLIQCTYWTYFGNFGNYSKCELKIPPQSTADNVFSSPSSILTHLMRGNY